MGSKYCLYFHINPVKQEIFYVGIGSEKRPYSKYKGDRSNYWHNIVKKYDYEVYVIEHFNNWTEACEREIYWIKRIGRKNLNEGTLINLTNGGDGVIGHKCSEKTKQKISKSGKGKHKNIIVSEATRDKVSKTLKLKKIKPPSRLGINHSEESKNKIRESSKGRKKLEESIRKTSEANGKKTINSKGVVFKTIRDAADYYNMKKTTLNAMLSGQNKNKTDLKYL